MGQLYFSLEAALQKVKHYCAYQERSHNEVREKLNALGIRGNDAEDLLSKLIEENYLNEERFAIAFARGKFRLKQWGIIKIKYQLNQKQVSPYCISKAIKEIDKEEYKKTLHKLFIEKLKTLKTEKNIFIKKKKLMDHLIQKGFETALIKEELKNI